MEQKYSIHIDEHNLIRKIFIVANSKLFGLKYSYLQML